MRYKAASLLLQTEERRSPRQRTNLELLLLPRSAVALLLELKKEEDERPAREGALLYVELTFLMERLASFSSLEGASSSVEARGRAGA